MPKLLTQLSEWTNARRKLVWLILFVLVVVVTLDGRRLEFFQKTTKDSESATQQTDLHDK